MTGPPDLHGPLARRLARIRRRLALWAALDGAATGAALATAATAVMVALSRLRGHGAPPAAVAVVIAAGALAGAAASGLRRISITHCARLADRALDGEDRVLSAVWLADSRAPLAAAAVADALARTERIEPRAVAPARPPAGLRALAGAAVVLAAIALVPSGTRAARLAPPRSVRVAAAPLPPGTLDVERNEAAAAIARAEHEGNPTARNLAAELDRIVRGLASGALDDAAALERLRALEQAAQEAREAAERDARAASGAAGALAASAATRPAAETLRRPSSGAETAEALAGAAGEHPTETARALRGASAAVAAGASPPPSAADEGGPSGRRRLNRETGGGGGETVDGAGKAASDESRHLERLARGLDEAASACAAGDPSCRGRAGSSGRELSDLQRRADSAPSMRELERSSRQLHDRIARGDLRSTEGQAARAFADAASGQAGAGQQGAGQMGAARAGSGQSSSQFAPSQKPSGQAAVAGDQAGGDQAAGVAAGMGTAEATSGTGSDPTQAAGSGIGHENGGPALGPRDESRAAAGRQENVSGAEGAGPSRAEVIAGAAGQGFASRPYTKVYADYRAAVEDALGSGAIPPGQQYLVRRYFDLIRPRAGGRAGGER